MTFRTKKKYDSSSRLFTLLISGLIFVLLTAVRNNELFYSLDKRCSGSIYRTKTFSNPVMLLFSRLGSGFFTVPLGVMLYFSYKRSNEMYKSKSILLNVIGIRVLNFLFKQLFKRKPPEWERLVEASKYGYPSAHTMNAAAFYSLLLFLTGLWKRVWAGWIYALFILMIGLSRVKLGIHYIADIVAGLAAGLFVHVLSMIPAHRKG
ncbi:phosphatase PAP2 family protein [Fictibacillus barbaricus]|uniref:Membrane-associated phospholipid phosphatase n=1 Tax=Fictibacillus barbaricus TaxID=182136 RepID=A0ABU1TVV7_9BACL|nr:phosphatase PAP2 family protein [Fictibacillus barbaricus]MDR7071333.1 membrane-associated phospholipid phosphatase [Fictibacillus barbaricus]